MGEPAGNRVRVADQQTRADADYALALGMLRHPWMQTLMGYLEEKRAGNEEAARDAYRVIAGSEDPYTGADGRVWTADQDYRYGLKAYGYAGGGGIAIHRGDVNIEGTPDPEIYRTERARLQGYRFRVPDGTYTLRLHFAEGFKLAPGRVFDLTVEGEILLKDFDLSVEAGAFLTAYIRELKDVSGSRTAN